LIAENKKAHWVVEMKKPVPASCSPEGESELAGTGIVVVIWGDVIADRSRSRETVTRRATLHESHPLSGGRHPVRVCLTSWRQLPACSWWRALCPGGLRSPQRGEGGVSSMYLRALLAVSDRC